MIVEVFPRRPPGAHTLQFQANVGRVANLTLRQASGEAKYRSADITQGHLELEGCDMTSKAASCVTIRNGADPRLRRNAIHGGKGAGVWVYDDGLGTLEDNDITANTNAGVEITAGGNPTLRRNRIDGDAYQAVIIGTGGKGVFEDNNLTGSNLGASKSTPAPRVT